MKKLIATYEITWYAENLTSGIYFYRLQAGKIIESGSHIQLLEQNGLYAQSWKTQVKAQTN